MRARTSVCLLVLAVAALALPLAAATHPAGPEIRVNTLYESKDKLPAIAFDRAGGAVVVWANDRLGITARFYNPAGQPLGVERVLVANQNLPGIPAEGEVVEQREPAAAVGPMGDLFVFWTEERSYLRVDHFWEDRELLGRAVFGQRFDLPSGRPLAEPFRVSGRSAALNGRPAVAVYGDRLFVVWHSEDAAERAGALDAIFGRFLDRAGSRLGAQFRIDTRAGVEPLLPNVAFNAAGQALVTWEGCCEISRQEVYGRAFDAAGAPVGPDVRLNTTTAGWQRRPVMAAGANGSFLVAWRSFDPAEDSRIRGQLVSAAGAPVGPERLLSTGAGAPDNGHYSPALAAVPGGFVVAWIEWLDNFPQAVYANRLDAAGVPVIERLRLSDSKVMVQQRLSLAGDGRGGVLAAWEGVHGKRQIGISARRVETQ